MRIAIRTLVLVAALISWAGTARADDVGAVGTVAGLQVNTTSADTYLQYHGRVLVKVSGDQLDEYRWGGTSCGTRVLTEPQVAALQQALGNKRVRIQPLSQDGQGDIICLVGFTIVPKPDLALVLP